MSAEDAAPRRHAPRGPLRLRDHMDGVDHKDAPQCTAKAKGSGQRCKRRPIPGGTVCVKHGGGAPQVKDAAQARLDRLVIPAIDRIAQLIEQKEFPSVAYQASKDVLDRQRGKAVEHIEAKVTNLNDLSDEDLRGLALQLLGISQ